MPPGADCVLTERELNRAVLARQLLLERGRMPLPRAVERVAGIQAQYAPSTYVGLWSRVDGFRGQHLDGALERRSLVQGTLMRATIHLVSRADYWPLTLAVREARRRWWLRATHGDPAAVERSARRLRHALADGPRWRSELPEAPTNEWSGAGIWLDVVRVPPSGTWRRRRADRYALAEHWLGPEPDHPDPLAHLVRRYLGGFGPATANDVASFTGIPVGSLRATLDRVATRRFRDERGTELVDVPRAPLPAADAYAPPRFLPTWDATLLVHARRAAILPEEHRQRIFSTKTPHSAPTFLVDGAVAGTWRLDGGRVRLEPFARLARDARAELEDEAERLAAFLADAS